MKAKAKSNPTVFILSVYAVCCFFRAIEYFLLRTDQGVVGEAFLHKLIGIALLAAVLSITGYKWQNIGFIPSKFVPDIGKGLLLGIGVFALAYGVEITLQSLSGNAPALSVYVTSYSIAGNRSLQGGVWLLLFCIIGNIINVIMEEGVFRGLFPKLTEEKHSFWMACVFSSVLFGVWHIAQPIRNAMDGEQSVMGALMSGVLLVVTSTLLGIQYCMLNKVTGSIWAGMAAHFVNNTTINLLHVSTNSGVDELQTIRITIAQTASFVIVLIIYLLNHRRNNRKAEQ